MSNCKYCTQKIKPRNKFCNSSCAASYNNSKRKHSESTKSKIREKLEGISRPRKVYKKQIIEGKVKRIETEKFLPSNCFICQKDILVYHTEIQNNVTCKSKECLSKSSSLGGKKSAQTRKKRSKDEIELFNLCSNYWSNVTSNSIISDGWDADIALNDLKVAILWNGPWHHKDMRMKNHSLLQVQTRDKIKTKIFESLGWKMLVFEDRHYTPEKAFEELKIILSELAPREGIEPSYNCLEDSCVIHYAIEA